eukprot:5154688-Pyramimonas_sp.AAC.1
MEPGLSYTRCRSELAVECHVRFRASTWTTSQRDRTAHASSCSRGVSPQHRAVSRAVQQIGATVQGAAFVRDLGIDMARGRKRRTTTAQ